MVCLMLMTGAAHGLSPHYRLDKKSPVLKQMGFELHSKYSDPKLVMCEVLFDENSKALPERGASVEVTADQSSVLGSTTLFQSDHTLGHFTSFFDHSTKRFGFRFYLSPNFIKDSCISFSIGGSSYEVRLLEYLSSYIAKPESSSSAGRPTGSAKNSTK